MSLNDTPSGERVHIGFFGRRNAGKSSVVNAVTGQQLAVVSDIKGTTTDPVQKAMELLPVGPVLIIDTPGFDDEGALGEKRIHATRRVLNRTDVAVLVVDAAEGLKACDNDLIELFQKKELPYLIAWNKSDLLGSVPADDAHNVYVSALNNANIWQLKESIAALAGNQEEKPLVRDIVHPGETAVLVIPIDKAAPKGRLILPQQMMIRDLLDGDALSLCVKEDRLAYALESLKEPPALVITDSQVFQQVAAVVPESVPLTSFSILLARKKGFLDAAVHGAAALKKLKDGDKVLISEGCTHHRQCDDIGTVKLPRWLREYTGAELQFETSSGREFPEDLSEYAMVIHCGACMLNEKEVQYRMKTALDQGIPFTNYGIAIACMKGILKRGVSIFPDLAKELEE